MTRASAQLSTIFHVRSLRTKNNSIKELAKQKNPSQNGLNLSENGLKGGNGAGMVLAELEHSSQLCAVEIKLSHLVK